MLLDQIANIRQRLQVEVFAQIRYIEQGVEQRDMQILGIIRS